MRGEISSQAGKSPELPLRRCDGWLNNRLIGLSSIAAVVASAALLPNAKAVVKNDGKNDGFIFVCVLVYVCMVFLLLVITSGNAFSLGVRRIRPGPLRGQTILCPA